MSCFANPPEQQLFQNPLQLCYMLNSELISYLYNTVYRGTLSEGILRLWLFGKSYKPEDINNLVLRLLSNHCVMQITHVLMRFDIETQFVSEASLIRSYYLKKGISPPKCNSILIWYINDDSYSVIVN
jgi:hypothetical protein